MSLLKRRPHTRVDFLRWEAEQEGRWELVNGVIRMMAGGTRAHNTIAGNIHTVLTLALRGKPCRPFQQNQMLTPRENDDAMYPDVLVVGSAGRDEDPTVDEATVIVEVVSKSSRERDYEFKWESYQEIAALRHYLIVEQDKRFVSVYSRSSAEEDWRFRFHKSLDSEIALDAIGVKLRVEEIYADTSLGRAA
jgi:Uma2 family endonuclease